MQREAERRYADMGAMSEDLRAYLEGRVVQAYESGGWAEFRSWVRRNRRLAAAVLAASVLLVLALAGLYARHVEQAFAARFYDLKLIDDLEDEARELWPPYPELAGEMRTWLDRAGELAERLETHQETLAGMSRGLALARDAELDERDGDPPEELVNRDENREATLERMYRTLGLARGAEAGGRDVEQWLLDKQVELVHRLRVFLGDTGSVSGVVERLEFASTVRQRTVEDYREEWDRAGALASDPEGPYQGLELRPQVGLVPLGPDLVSGRLEFAVLQSGEPPARDAGGRLVLKAESALVLVLLPGGVVQLGGSPGDEYADLVDLPRTSVPLAAFFLSKYEMTRSQWRRIAPERQGKGESVPEVGEGGDDELAPISSISWNHCREVLHQLGLVLPTEAQWEFAARAGTSTPWWWGDEFEQGRGLEVVDTRDVRVIGSRAANPFGLYDVLGNVGEWCRDVYMPYGEGVPRDAWDGARADEDQNSDLAERVQRGGFHQVSNSLDTPHMLELITRASMRLVGGPADLRSTVGVRPARALAP